MTSPDTPQPVPPQPTIPQPETADDLLDEVLQSDNPATGPENLTLAGSAQLAEQVSNAVTGTTGVVRIEPTLKNAIVKLTAAAHHIATGISRTSPANEPDRYLAVDGVSVVIRDDHADVSVDIVANMTQPARTTAHLTHTSINRTIHQAGLTPGHAVVRILVVEHPLATSDQ